MENSNLFDALTACHAQVMTALAEVAKGAKPAAVARREILNAHRRAEAMATLDGSSLAELHAEIISLARRWLEAHSLKSSTVFISTNDFLLLLRSATGDDYGPRQAARCVSNFRRLGFQGLRRGKDKAQRRRGYWLALPVEVDADFRRGENAHCFRKHA